MSTFFLINFLFIFITRLKNEEVDMKGRTKLDIACIHKNWIAVQNTKSARLSRQISNGSQNVSVINQTQPQEGCYHVFVRGYNSYTIFYDIEDRVHFLLILDEEAKKVRAKISAFILMDNHFHLQVFTSQLSCLMGMTLQRYSLRFRRKHGIEGRIFKKIFGRSQIFSLLLAKENLLYILSNASRENICATHRDYVWSSYGAHPEVISLRNTGMLSLPMLVPGKLERPKGISISEKHNSSSSCLNGKSALPTPKRSRGCLPSAQMIAGSDINQVIMVDSSFMVSAFKSLEDFDYSIHSYEPLKNRLLSSQPLDVQPLNTPDTNKSFKITPDYDVIALFNELLNGRKFSMITSYERAQMIQKLKREKNATRRQISSIMRI